MRQDRTDNGREGWIGATALVSVSYLVAFLLTFGILMSVEDRISPVWANFTSLIFLPHGVRVLAAWLYGWRSVLYLLPGVAIGHVYLYGWTIDARLGLGWIVGLSCAPLAFSVLAAAGADFRLSRRRRLHWRDVVLVGAVASVFNSGFSGLAYGNDLQTMSARFVGDVAGVYACVLLIMAGLRIRDRWKWG